MAEIPTSPQQSKKPESSKPIQIIAPLKRTQAGESASYQRQLREKTANYVEGAPEGWSHLVPIMVPAKGTEGNFLPRHGDNFGYYLSDWVSKENLRSYIEREYGIFEFFIIHMIDCEYMPVFIGSTHVAMGCNPGTLLDCVEAYMTHGGDKKNVINKILRRGYRIEVRIKNTLFNMPASLQRKESERMLEEMLGKYDYLWNEECNGY